ncbi:MAG: alpha/beta hydrolase [Candidatus Neomarinimicrobiota bacterium]
MLKELIIDRIMVRPGRELSLQTGGRDGATMVLLIHGAGGRGDQWQYQVAELAEKYFIVVPDLPGHGRSPEPRSGYAFTELAADLEAVFLTYQRRCNIIIGHSYGTAFALWLSGRFGAAVEGTILIGAAPLRPPNGNSIWNLPVWLLRLLRPIFSKNFAVGAFHPDADPEFIRRERAISDRNSMRMMKALFNGMHYDGDHDLSRLTTPFLIINGEADKFTTVAAGQKLAGQLPAAQFVVVPQVAHLVMLEQPRVVNELIGGFIAGGG